MVLRRVRCCLVLTMVMATAAACLLFAHRALASNLSGWKGDPAWWRYCYVDGMRFKVQGKGELDLEAGEMLIESFAPVTITTPMTKINLKHRAVVMVKVQPGRERCWVVWESGGGAVSVVSNNRDANLGVGEEVLVSDHDPQYHEMMPDDAIGRRRVKLHRVGGGKTMATMEFSLLQALERHPLLSAISHSHAQEDKELKARILKTVAVLNYATKGHGYFSSGSRF